MNEFLVTLWRMIFFFQFCLGEKFSFYSRKVLFCCWMGLPGIRLWAFECLFLVWNVFEIYDWYLSKNFFFNVTFGSYNFELPPNRVIWDAFRFVRKSPVKHDIAIWYVHILATSNKIACQMERKLACQNFDFAIWHVPWK
jgi:hypothetical protein